MSTLNALYSVTFETDQQYKANYFENFKKFTITTEENDWTVDGAMTNPKGGRPLAPHAQPDADMYLHVAERRPDGIIVHDVRTHQIGVTSSHEVIVMSTIVMGPSDKDYATSPAIPTDAEGIFMITDRQSCDTRKLEGSEIDADDNGFGDVEALAVFDDVFVPNDRISLNGEVEFAGILAERFVGYHRQGYDGCKVGVGDVLIDTATLTVKYNGVERASIMKDKLIEMIHLNETPPVCGITCSSEGKFTSSGNYLIDLLLAGIYKQNTTRFPYETVRLAEDIAGGLMVTIPSEKDLRDPVVGPYVGEYLRGINAVPTENRLCTLRLTENISLDMAAVGYRTESMYDAGSPQAQRIMIVRQGNISAKKELVKAIVYIN